MAESLVASWLSHVIKCQVVQTNWKIDLSLFNKNASFVNMLFTPKIKNDYFGEGKIETIVRQGECDVLGIKFGNQGSISEIHAVDVAFHTDGLGYGNKKENVKRVIKKCLRTAICIYGGLHIDMNVRVYVYFATPLITKRELDDANSKLKEIEKEIESRLNSDSKIVFRILANEVFYDKVVDQVVNMYTTVHDTNELFLRSYQLWKMGEGFSKKTDGESPVNNIIKEDIVPGYLANVVLRTLLKTISLDNILIQQLVENHILLDNQTKEDKEHTSNSTTWYAESIKLNGQPYWISNDCRKRVGMLQDFINKIRNKYKDELQPNDVD